MAGPSYVAMLRFGRRGSLAGILVGELFDIIAVIVLIRLETRQPGLVNAY
jgi:hypothetical protein